MPEGRPRILHATRWTIASQVLQAGLQLLQTAILARLLVPGDFGLVSIALAATGFLASYADLGISSGIIHHQRIDADQLSSLYMLNVLSGAVVALAIVALAPLAAAYYAQPALQPVLTWMALALFVTALGNQFRVLNQKHLRFQLMAHIDIGAACASFIAAAVAAWLGLGVFAFVAAILANAVASTTANILTGLRHHRPTLRLRFAETRRFLRFGAYQMADSNLSYFLLQVDVLVLGRLVGAPALGQYSIAKNLCLRPSALVNPVFARIALPLMSLRQDERGELKAMYLRGLGLLGAINFPVYMAMAVLADPIVRVLFGPNWQQAVPLLRVLALYFLVRSSANPVGSLMMATGRMRRSMLWNATLLLLLPVVIVLVAPFGVVRLAWALLGLQLALVLPAWFVLVRPATGAGWLEYLAPMARPFAIAAVAGAAVAGIGPFGAPVLDLAVRGTLFAAVYVGLSFAFNAGATQLALRTLGKAQ
jgi:O-antigen/teichoic acid export membrane protein